MSTQPAPVANNAAVQTPKPPTHSFGVNFAPVNLAELLKKYGLGGYRAETVSSFKAGPATLNFHQFTKEGEPYIPGQTMLDRGSEIEGDRFGLPSFLAMLEDQSSIPSECRGNVAVVCEDVLVVVHGNRCLAYALWDDFEQRWFVDVLRLVDGWYGNVRLARCGK